MSSVQSINHALIWRGGFSVDADGSPKAYAPYPHEGLDYLANAGTFGNYYGLACSSFGIPFLQTSTDPAPGYYVSTTALTNPLYPNRDPRRYVDASTIPYISVAGDLTHGIVNRVHLGDVGMVIYGEKRSGAIVADVSPRMHYGEGSIALAESLDIPSSPKHGGVSKGVTWLIFPGSKTGWPRSTADFQKQAEFMFQSWGGLAKVAEVFK